MGNIYNAIQTLGKVAKGQSKEPDAIGSAIVKFEDGSEHKILDFKSMEELESRLDEIVEWLVEHDIKPSFLGASIVGDKQEVSEQEKAIKYPSLVFTMNGKLVELASI
jgi:hypothetical protein